MKRLKNSSQIISKENLVDYLNRVDNSITEANTLMFNAITTKKWSYKSKS
ncbi:MAG: hypothetical protein KatS3mg068_1281 [Candidatus Sericytochromatia bacterium]|nr:MAG: hypothetical protein KatS3mg068_1281 [Candidatus Sericytochromatia bacterium]